MVMTGVRWILVIVGVFLLLVLAGNLLIGQG